MNKKATEQEIKDAFIELLDKNGETTSKDVKDLLRSEGFWIYQKEVSDLLGQVYNELGTERTNNGEYYVYTPIVEDDDAFLDDFYGQDYEDEDIVDEDDETEQVIKSVTGYTSSIFDNTQFLGGISDDEKVKKGKILGDTITIGVGTYVLPVEYDGKRNDLFVSTHNDLHGFGTLVYEVRTNNRVFYLYSPDADIITRHRAIYYVWKVINQEIDEFLKYKELRSTKLYKA